MIKNQKMKTLLLTLFFIFNFYFFIAQNNTTVSSCNFYIHNNPSNSLNCANICNDTLYLCPGDSLDLQFSRSCAVGAIISFHWQKNGHNLPNDTSGYSFTVKDTGVYSCQFGNTINSNIDSVGYIHVICSGSTGVRNFTSDNKSISVYPNPAGNFINIEGIKNAEIKLVDILGYEILSTNQNQLYINNLPNGIYFVQIQTSANSHTQKIIVQH